MKITIGDTELQEAVAEYIEKRFPNFEMGKHEWSRPSDTSANIESIKVEVQLVAKEDEQK